MAIPVQKAWPLASSTVLCPGSSSQICCHWVENSTTNLLWPGDSLCRTLKNQLLEFLLRRYSDDEDLMKNSLSLVEGEGDLGLCMLVMVLAPRRWVLSPRDQTASLQHKNWVPRDRNARVSCKRFQLQSCVAASRGRLRGFGDGRSLWNLRRANRLSRC